MAKTSTSFKKGHKVCRPKGVQNKVTTDIKEAYKMLIEANIPNLTGWLERIAEKDPAKAITLLSELSEYVVPKLARTDMNIGNKEGEQLSVNIKIVDSGNKDEQSI